MLKKNPRRYFRPRGKCRSSYNTNIGKRKGNLLPKNEEISGGKSHTNTRKHIWYISTIIDVFLNQKRLDVCEHAWRHLYLVFTYIYFLLIEKDICDRRNISNKFLCVFPPEILSFFDGIFLSFIIFCAKIYFVVHIFPVFILQYNRLLTYNFRMQKYFRYLHFRKSFSVECVLFSDLLGIKNRTHYTEKRHMKR